MDTKGRHLWQLTIGQRPLGGGGGAGVVGVLGPAESLPPPRCLASSTSKDCWQSRLPGSPAHPLRKMTQCPHTNQSCPVKKCCFSATIKSLKIFPNAPFRQH